MCQNTTEQSKGFMNIKLPNLYPYEDEKVRPDQDYRCVCGDSRHQCPILFELWNHYLVITNTFANASKEGVM
jgi:hypothetical protein